MAERLFAAGENENIQSVNQPQPELAKNPELSVQKTAPTRAERGAKVFEAESEVQNAKDADRVMEESDDPGVLLETLDAIFKWDREVGDWQRGYANSVLGLNADVENVEAVRPHELTEAMFKAVGLDFKSGEAREAFDSDENAPFSENFARGLETIVNDPALAARVLGEEVATLGVETVTSPIGQVAGAIAPVAKMLKAGYQSLKNLKSEKIIKAAEKQGVDPKKLEAIDAVEDTPIVNTSEGAEQPIRTFVIDEEGRKIIRNKLVIAGTKAQGVDKAAFLTKLKTELTGGRRSLDDIDKELKELQSSIPTKPEEGALEAARVEALNTRQGKSLKEDVKELRESDPTQPLKAAETARFEQAKEEILANQVTASDFADEFRKKGLMQEAELAENAALDSSADFLALDTIQEARASATGLGLKSLDLKKKSKAIRNKMSQELKTSADKQTYLQNTVHMTKSQLKKLAPYFDDESKIGKAVNVWRRGMIATILTPASHFANLTYGAGNFVWNSVNKMTAAGVNTIRGGDGPDFVDAMSYVSSGLMGSLESVVALGKMARGQKDAFAKLVVEQDKIDEISKLGFSADKGSFRQTITGEENPISWLIKRTLNGVDRTFDYNLRGLQIADVLQAHIFTRSEMAYRASQLSRRIIKDQKLEGAEASQAIKAQYNKIMQDPNEFADLAQKSYDHGKEMVLTNALTGVFKALEDARKIDSGTGKLASMMIPFYRTLVNASGQKFERMPGFQFLSPRLKSKLKSDDPIVRREAQANIAMAWTGLFAGWQMNDSGILGGRLSGNPRIREVQEQMGLTDYQLEIESEDGTSVGIDLRRLPSMDSVAMGALLREAGGWMTEGEYQEAFFSALSFGAETVTDNNWAKGFTDIMDTFAKFGTDGQKMGAAADRLIGTYTLTAPNTVAWFKRLVDPEVKDVDGPLQRAMEVWGADAPAERDIFGKAVHYGWTNDKMNVLERTTAMMTGSIMKIRKRSEDQKLLDGILQPMFKYGIAPSTPTRELGNITLTTQELDDYNDLFYLGQTRDQSLSSADSTLVTDIVRATREWGEEAKTFNQADERELLRANGASVDEVRDLTPSVLLQNKIQKIAGARKEAALALLITKHERLAQDLSVQERLGDITTGRVENSAAISTRPTNEVLSDREKEIVDDRTTMEKVFDQASEISEDLNIAIGGNR